MQDNEVPIRQNLNASKGAGSASKVKNKTSLKMLWTLTIQFITLKMVFLNV
jgi:hypothetical protein